MFRNLVHPGVLHTVLPLALILITAIFGVPPLAALVLFMVLQLALLLAEEYRHGHFRGDFLPWATTWAVYWLIVLGSTVYLSGKGALAWVVGIVILALLGMAVAFGSLFFTQDENEWEEEDDFRLARGR